MRNLFKIEDNWILFWDLFSPNRNGDSIRPLAQELRKINPDFKFFFCLKKKDKYFDIDMADVVLYDKSLKFKYVLKKAKYIISPMAFPKFRKRKGQILVQTWHGSPLKKLYLSKDKNNKKYQKYAKLFKDTDIFLSQAQIHNKNLAEAFNLKNSQIYNFGLPRNDILFKDNRDFISDLKKKLCLPSSKKILFYCPTWRRYDYRAVLPFDIEELKKEFEDEYILLIRSHVGLHDWVDNNNNKINIFDNKFSFNGGNYPDATHLYLLSDVLITDYSSALFDFAITKKPQIFYAYDRKEYEKEFGFYFDYDFVPGDIAQNEQELIRAIKNLDKYEEKYRRKYEDFSNLYLENESGMAAAKTVDLMMKLGKRF